MIRITEPADYANALLRLRTQAGLSQLELANRADTNQPQISHHEHGQHGPRLATLIRVVHVLGYDLALIPQKDTP